ncbi:MAG: universal stress protein [Rhodobiaceae bacterium]|nr:universal stress protein [Rhodobiaceae bacterium]
MFDRILVPIDLADAERGKASIGIARAVGGKNADIHLVSVIEDAPRFVAAQVPREITDRIRAEAETAIKDIAAAAGIKASNARVRTGSAASGILETADELQADLIIVGSHKPGLQDYLLGSTAARVVRHANCKVLVVR